MFPASSSFEGEGTVEHGSADWRDARGDTAAVSRRRPLKTANGLPIFMAAGSPFFPSPCGSRPGMQPICRSAAPLWGAIDVKVAALASIECRLAWSSTKATKQRLGGIMPRAIKGDQIDVYVGNRVRELRNEHGLIPTR